MYYLMKRTFYIRGIGHITVPKASTIERGTIDEMTIMMAAEKARDIHYGVISNIWIQRY